ncbi:MAG: multicopper oxidase domain-containing protein [Nitrosomonas sp.]|nr:multicopper oxidase domain-containing protein [Nitrosomonas sp.]
MLNKPTDIQKDYRKNTMNMKTEHSKNPATIVLGLLLLAAMLLASPALLAAVHNIALTAELLPNGQLAYKQADGAKAVIPGPTLFVTEGDTVNVTLVNNTAVPVGFKIPGQPQPSSAKAQPGKSKNYKFTAKKAGTYVYHGNNGKEQLGLFGAIVVNKATGTVDRYVDDNGALITVNQNDLDKQYVLFMVGSTFWGTEITSDGTQIPLWANPTPAAVQDEIVRFHILSVGPAHTFHLHAHRWLKEGTDEIIDTKLLADGADTHSFTIKSGSGVGAGDWQFHCHLISHMEAGMHGSFRVVSAGGDGSATVGASPYGRILLGTEDVPGLVTFEVSDEPGSWFRNTRGDAIVNLGLDIKTRSLEVIGPGSSVNFVMSDTNGVHTITSLLWPTGAHHMPFDQEKAYKGGAILKLDTPGLYVFTCKIHPYMFGAVIVDSDQTTGISGVPTGLDLGDASQNRTIDLVTGLTNLPTNSDLAIRLLRTFFVATAKDNWQRYGEQWTVTFPALPVNITGVDGLVLSALNINGGVLVPRNPPAQPGVGEVWINTQFEKTAGKTKPGTITVIDTANWTVKRKIALPQINMNNPHNMWTDKTQETIFQTQWFDNKLTLLNRADGSWIRDIKVGDSPSHVMTIPGTDVITVAINGENGIAYIQDVNSTEVNRITPTQPAGHVQANPHGHWITPDGKMVTPNINTSDTGFYDGDTGQILARTQAGGNFPKGPHPIAIGVGKDKIYAANLLDHSISVYDFNGNPVPVAANGGKPFINLIAPYNPITGAGALDSGILPIQTPVDPTGRVMVTANTGGTITIVDTVTDTVVAVLPCDPGCHGVNFGAKAGGGYYAYVTSKFSNRLIVLDVDLDNPANTNFAGDILLADNGSLIAGDTIDDTVADMAGMGGQGILAVPNVYNGWVQNIAAGSAETQGWVNVLTAGQKAAVHPQP